MRIFLASWRATYAETRLVAAARRLGLEARIVSPFEVAGEVRAGDLVLNRLDVKTTLDGVEPGLGRLRRLEHSGVRILNRAPAQRAAHDKLTTALNLRRRRVAHPRTAHLTDHKLGAFLPFPLVLKPRFGSWGKDVLRCETRAELSSSVRRIAQRSWFRRHGALLQELVSGDGRDLRILVAAGRVVGAVERMAAPGEWRTNVSLGGARRPVHPTDDACRVALASVAALDLDFACVDVVTRRDGMPLALEVNAAPEFTGSYSCDGMDVFDTVARSLLLGTPDRVFARPA